MDNDSSSFSIDVGSHVDMVICFLRKNNLLGYVQNISNKGIILKKPTYDEVIGWERLNTLSEIERIFYSLDLKHVYFKTFISIVKDIGDIDVVIETNSLKNIEKTFKMHGFKIVEREIPYKTKLKKGRVILDVHTQIVQDGIIFEKKRRVLSNCQKITIGQLDLYVPTLEEDTYLILVNSFFGDNILKLPTILHVLFSLQNNFNINAFTGLAKDMHTEVGIYYALQPMIAFSNIFYKQVNPKLRLMVNDLLYNKMSSYFRIFNARRQMYFNKMIDFLPKRYPFYLYLIALFCKVLRDKNLSTCIFTNLSKAVKRVAGSYIKLKRDELLI